MQDHGKSFVGVSAVIDRRQVDQKIEGFFIPQTFCKFNDIFRRTIESEKVGLMIEIKKGVLGKKRLDEIFVNHGDYPILRVGELRRFLAEGSCPILSCSFIIASSKASGLGGHPLT